MKSTFKFLAITLVTIALFSSCSSTLLKSSWTQTGYTGQKYSKVMVFAIAAKVSSRTAVESAMVDELKESGINAVSSMSVFPNSQSVTAEQIKAIPKEEMAQKLKDNNIDGLLILSLLDKKSEQVYVEGATYTQPSTIYHPTGFYGSYYNVYPNYYSYYSTVYTTVSEPGYYKEQTTYYLESNFYRISDASLVWSGQAEAIDPADVAKGSRDWATEVVDGLKTAKIILP